VKAVPNILEIMRQFTDQSYFTPMISS